MKNAAIKLAHRVKVLALWAIMAVLTGSAQSKLTQKHLFPIHKNGKGGYIDSTGKVVIPFVFDAAGDFSEGMARVEIDKKWGYIDETGRLVIEPRYHWVWEFSEGLARVQIDSDLGKCGFINIKGEAVIEPKYAPLSGVADISQKFQDGLAMIEVNYRKGFIDKNGTEVIPPKFEYAYPFSEGLACVQERLGAKWGYIDKIGAWTIKPQFEYASLFSEGLAPVGRQGVCGYINKTGKMVLRPNYRSSGDCAVVTGHFQEGISRWQVGEKFGYIDRTGSLVIRPRFALTDHFSEGLAYVGTGDKWGFINRNGKLVIPLQDWHRVESFEGEFAYIVTLDGRHGYINKSGEYVWFPAKQSNDD